MYTTPRALLICCTTWRGAAWRAPLPRQPGAKNDVSKFLQGFLKTAYKMGQSAHLDPPFKDVCSAMALNWEERRREHQLTLDWEERRREHQAAHSQVLRWTRVGKSDDKILLRMWKFGVKADERSSDFVGHSPLHVAAQKGRRSLMKFFLGGVVDVNVLNRMGHPPIHHAVLNGHMEVVVLLLNNGATVISTTFHFLIGRQGIIGIDPSVRVPDELIWLMTREVARTGTRQIGHEPMFCPLAVSLAGPVVEQEFSHTRPRQCGWREATAMQRRVAWQGASTTEPEYDPTVRWSHPTEHVGKRKAKTKIVYIF